MARLNVNGKAEIREREESELKRPKAAVNVAVTG
jgi:hypothetical protein